ncbi:maleylpyruvate isomerase N-terminal domain-containing protein [Streptacidiphilus monticola]
MASIELLERALAQTEHLVAAVRPEQGDDPTPCRSWEVGRLISHLVYDLGEFTARASGRDPDWSGGFPDVLPEDWSPAFRSGADLLLHAWRAGGSGLDEERQRFTLSQQAAELAVHDWDLARATAQPTASLDPELATASLAWAQAALQPASAARKPRARSSARKCPSPWTPRSRTAWQPSSAGTPLGRLRRPADALWVPGRDRGRGHRCKWALRRAAWWVRWVRSGRLGAWRAAWA